MASPQRGEPGIAVLYAWPSNEELAALAVGERLNMDVVAKAEVSPEGEFELRLADGAGLSEYSSESGDLNLLLSAEFDGSVYEYNVGLDPVAVENAEPGEAAVESVAPEPVADVEATSGRAYAEKGCSTKKVAELGSKWVTVASIYSSNTGTEITHSYREGQATTMGVAVALSGANAGYEVSGTTTVSSTGTIGFGTSTGKTAEHLQTLFQHGKFTSYCSVGKGGTRSKTYMRAYNWIGGARSYPASMPTARYCVPYKKNGSYVRDSGDQTTRTHAVSIVGVKLPATTAWSKSGKTTYRFKSKGGKLCGAKSHANDRSKSPGSIVAK
ncbi:hypothetical protein [Leucobacter sp.]